MLEKPNAGWTKVCIGDFIGWASYITDVPVKCLKAFINGYPSNLPITIRFDAEGHEHLRVPVGCFYKNGVMYIGRNIIPSSTLKSPVCNT